MLFVSVCMTTPMNRFSRCLIGIIALVSSRVTLSSVWVPIRRLHTGKLAVMISRVLVLWHSTEQNLISWSQNWLRAQVWITRRTHSGHITFVSTAIRKLAFIYTGYIPRPDSMLTSYNWLVLFVRLPRKNWIKKSYWKAPFKLCVCRALFSYTPRAWKFVYSPL